MIGFQGVGHPVRVTRVECPKGRFPFGPLCNSLLVCFVSGFRIGEALHPGPPKGPHTALSDSLTSSPLLCKAKPLFLLAAVPGPPLGLAGRACRLLVRLVTTSLELRCFEAAFLWARRLYRIFGSLRRGGSRSFSGDTPDHHA